MEWKGFAYECVKTKVSGRGWECWYKLPFIHYDEMPNQSDKTVETVARYLSYSSGMPMLRGEDVRALQVNLNALGYACGEADGIFGSKTVAAARAFQRDHGLEVDGIVGEKTRAALETALIHTRPKTQEPADEHNEGAAPDGEAPDSDEGDSDDDEEDYVPPKETEVMDFGTRLLRYRKGHAYMTGNDIEAVQKRLVQLGYNPGKADGIYGPKTVAAVREFQAARKIEADGVVGTVTRRELLL